MKAVAIQDGTNGPVLTVVDTPVPELQAGHILVRARAVGVNRADLVRAKSHFGSDNPSEVAIAGMEVAGEVAACGEGVTRFKPGDAVIAMAARSYAEYCAVHESIASPAPSGLDWPHALAACNSYITAHNALITAARMQAGDAVLVQGAGSAAGIASVQVAALFGARIVAGSSGKPFKLERLAGLGLTIPLPRNGDGISDETIAEMTGTGFDVIIDNVGNGALGFNIRAAAVQGRIVSVGRLGGYVDTLNIDELARKRLSLIGVTFRTRSLEEHAEVVRAYERDILPAFASGRLTPQVDSTFPLLEAAAAQDYMALDRHFGKIVLTVA